MNVYTFIMYKCFYYAFSYVYFHGKYLMHYVYITLLQAHRHINIQNLLITISDCNHKRLP